MDIKEMLDQALAVRMIHRPELIYEPGPRFRSKPPPIDPAVADALIRALERTRDEHAAAEPVFIVDAEPFDPRPFRDPLTRVGPVRSGSLREFDDEDPGSDRPPRR